MTITFKDSLGEIVRVLKTITDPKQGQECVVLWTNCNNQYEAKGIIAGVNKRSVVPKWPHSTGKNGVFEVKA
jgi:hypothetical protein